jgi:hypothetical protein
MLLFHGSSKPHKIGSILQAKKRPTEWGHRKIYGVEVEQIVESRRPLGEISRLQCIFMVRKKECLNLAGASEDYVYRVEPIGHITKAHFGWFSHILGLLFDLEEPPPDYKPLSKPELMRQIFAAADNYWAGIKYRKIDRMTGGTGAWEYLTKEVRFIEKVPPSTFRY